ncbi:MAG: thioredoxin-disulfide reductase [Succinivibrionaceae bacterium]
MSNHKVIIIGSGPAGCTAAIYAARANLNPIVITGMQYGGQLTQTPKIENWPGEPSISGIDLMEKLIAHAQGLGVEFINQQIEDINFSKRPFVLKSDEEVFEADTVIIATGASPKNLGIPSEEKFLHNGISYCATCDGFFYKDQEVAVIGGGNTALVETLYLSNICKKVYLVHRRDSFRAEQIVINQIYEKVNEGKIELVLNANVKEITGSELNGVEGFTAIYNDNTTKDFKVNGIFIAIGHTPNTLIFSPVLDNTNGTLEVGCINGYETSCSIPGIFAAGDCADHNYRQAITSAGTGCKAALDVEHFLTNSNKNS